MCFSDESFLRDPFCRQRTPVQSPPSERDPSWTETPGQNPPCGQRQLLDRDPLCFFMILACLFDMIWHVHCFEGGGLVQMWPLQHTFPLPWPGEDGPQGNMSRACRARSHISRQVVSPVPLQPGTRGCSALRGPTCHHKCIYD